MNRRTFKICKGYNFSSHGRLPLKAVFFIRLDNSVPHNGLEPVSLHFLQWQSTLQTLILRRTNPSAVISRLSWTNRGAKSWKRLENVYGYRGKGP